MVPGAAHQYIMAMVLNTVFSEFWRTQCHPWLSLDSKDIRHSATLATWDLLSARLRAGLREGRRLRLLEPPAEQAGQVSGN